MIQIPIYRGRAIRRAGAALLVAVYAATNVLWPHAAEANFWSDRKKAAQRLQSDSSDGLPAAPAGLASLTPEQQKLFAQLPRAAEIPMAGAPVASAGAGLAVLSPSSPSNFPGADPNLPASAWLSTLILPYGSLREIHLSPAENAPLIIHVQDAHGIEEAQRNIAGLIQSLQENRGVNLVGVEGAEGAFSLVEPLRDIGGPGVAKDVAGAFLKEGVIGGAEYAALTSPRAPVLWGVESMADYEANVRAVKDSFARRAEITAVLEPLSKQASSLKEKVYSPALKEFDREVSGYREQKEPLGKYVRYLMGAGGAGWKGFPNLALLLQALNAEEKLDFHKVEQERLQLVERLAKALPRRKLEDLVQKSFQYRLGQCSYGQYHAYLRDLCQRNGVSLQDLPQMRAYIDYVLLADCIEREHLLDELDARESSVERTLADTAPRRRLADASRRLTLAGKLVRHEMTPGDWAAYQRDRAEVLRLPQELAALEGNASPQAAAGPDMAALISPFEEFCRLALTRNERFVSSLLGKMKTEQAKAAVLVAGGFHSEDLVRRLRNQGASVVVVTPKITEIPKDVNYLDVFARDPLPLEKMFRGEVISLIRKLGVTQADTAARIALTETALKAPLDAAAGTLDALEAKVRAFAAKLEGVEDVSFKIKDGKVSVRIHYKSGPSAVAVAAEQDALASAASAAGFKLERAFRTPVGDKVVLYAQLVPISVRLEALAARTKAGLEGLHAARAAAARAVEELQPLAEEAAGPVSAYGDLFIENAWIPILNKLREAADQKVFTAISAILDRNMPSQTSLAFWLAAFLTSGDDEGSRKMAVSVISRGASPAKLGYLLTRTVLEATDHSLESLDAWMSGTSISARVVNAASLLQGSLKARGLDVDFQVISGPAMPNGITAVPDPKPGRPHHLKILIPHDELAGISVRKLPFFLARVAVHEWVEFVGGVSHKDVDEGGLKVTKEIDRELSDEAVVQEVDDLLEAAEQLASKKGVFLHRADRLVPSPDGRFQMEIDKSTTRIRSDQDAEGFEQVASSMKDFYKGVLGRPMGEVLEVIRKATGRTLKAEDLERVVKIGFHDQGANKWTFKVTFTMKDGSGEVPLLLALKKEKRTSLMQPLEVEDLQRLSNSGRTPRFAGEFEQGGRKYILEEFIDGPTAREALSAGALTQERREKAVDALLDLSILMGGVMPEDIHAANVMFDNPRGGDERAVIVDLGHRRMPPSKALLRLISFYGFFGEVAGDNRFIFESFLSRFGLHGADNGLELLRKNVEEMADGLAYEQRRNKKPGETSLRKKMIREEREEAAMQPEDVRRIIEEARAFIAEKEAKMGVEAEQERAARGPPSALHAGSLIELVDMLARKTAGLLFPFEDYLAGALLDQSRAADRVEAQSLVRKIRSGLPGFGAWEEWLSNAVFNYLDEHYFPGRVLTEDAAAAYALKSDTLKSAFIERERIFPRLHISEVSIEVFDGDDLFESPSLFIAAPFRMVAPGKAVFRINRHVMDALTQEDLVLLADRELMLQSLLDSGTGFNKAHTEVEKFRRHAALAERIGRSLAARRAALSVLRGIPVDQRETYLRTARGMLSNIAGTLEDPSPLKAPEIRAQFFRDPVLVRTGLDAGALDKGILYSLVNALLRQPLTRLDETLLGDPKAEVAAAHRLAAGIIAADLKTLAAAPEALALESFPNLTLSLRNALVDMAGDRPDVLKEAAIAVNAMMATMSSRDAGSVAEAISVAGRKEWIVLQMAEIAQTLSSHGLSPLSVPDVVKAAVEAARGREELLRQAFSEALTLAQEGKDPWRFLQYGVSAAVRAEAKGVAGGSILKDLAKLSTFVEKRPDYEGFYSKTLGELADAVGGQQDLFRQVVLLALSMGEKERALSAVFFNVPDLLEATRRGAPSWAFDKSWEAISLLEGDDYVDPTVEALAALVRVAGGRESVMDEAINLTRAFAAKGWNPAPAIMSGLVPAAEASSDKRWVIQAVARLWEEAMNKGIAVDPYKMEQILPGRYTQEGVYRSFVDWFIAQSVAGREKKTGPTVPAARLILNLLEATAEEGIEDAAKLREQILGLTLADLDRWSDSAEFIEIPGIFSRLGRTGDAVSLVTSLIRKRDVSAVDALNGALSVRDNRLDLAIMRFLSGPARYDLKFEVALLISEWSLVAADPQVKTGTSDIERLFLDFEGGEMTGGKMLSGLARVVNETKGDFCKKVLGVDIPPAMLQDGALMSKLGTLASLHEGVRQPGVGNLSPEEKALLSRKIKEAIRIFVDANKDAAPGKWDHAALRNWVTDGIPENKAEKDRLIAEGYSPELFTEGVTVRGMARVGLSEDELRSNVRQEAHQILDIAVQMGLLTAEEAQERSLSSAAEAEAFVDRISGQEKAALEFLEKEYGEAGSARKVYDQYVSQIIPRILETVRKREAAVRADIEKASSTNEEEAVTIVIRKDFIEEANAGVGVPGCFNPRTGGHREMPPLHGLEANTMIAMAYDAKGRMIANVVLALTDQGVVVFQPYNGRNLSLQPLWAEAWKELAKKAPAVLLTTDKAAGARSIPDAAGRRAAEGYAVRRPSLWQNPYFDFGSVNVLGEARFSLTGALLVTRESLEKSGEYAASQALRAKWRDGERAREKSGKEEVREEPQAEELPSAPAVHRPGERSALNALKQALAAPQTFKARWYRRLASEIKRSRHGLAGVTRDEVAAWLTAISVPAVLIERIWTVVEAHRAARETDLIEKAADALGERIQAAGGSAVVGQEEALDLFHDLLVSPRDGTALDMSLKEEESAPVSPASSSTAGLPFAEREQFRRLLMNGESLLTKSVPSHLDALETLFGEYVPDASERIAHGHLDMGPSGLSLDLALNSRELPTLEQEDFPSGSARVQFDLYVRNGRLYMEVVDLVSKESGNPMGLYRSFERFAQFASNTLGRPVVLRAETAVFRVATNWNAAAGRYDTEPRPYDISRRFGWRQVRARQSQVKSVWINKVQPMLARMGIRTEDLSTRGVDQGNFRYYVKTISPAPKTLGEPEALVKHSTTVQPTDRRRMLLETKAAIQQAHHTPSIERAVDGLVQQVRDDGLQDAADLLVEIGTEEATSLSTRDYIQRSLVRAQSAGRNDTFHLLNDTLGRIRRTLKLADLRRQVLGPDSGAARRAAEELATDLSQNGRRETLELLRALAEDSSTPREILAHIGTILRRKMNQSAFSVLVEQVLKAVEAASSAPQPSQAAGLPAEVEAGGKRYRVTGLLGKSSLGEVYDAVDPETGRAVAIKVVSAAWLKGEGMVSLEKEAGHLRRGGPFPAFIAFDKDDKRAVLVMEKIEGKTLRQLMDTRGRAPFEDGRAVGLALLKAAGELHAGGFVHRDLKPENIMWDGSRITLLDPGFMEKAGASQEGVRGGRPQFMPPEYFRPGGAVAFNEDLYAVAAILQTLWTGFTPSFPKGDEGEGLTTAEAMAGQRLQAARSAGTDPVAAFLGRNLSMDPKGRSQTAEEMAAALGALPLTYGFYGRAPPTPGYQAVAEGHLRDWLVGLFPESSWRFRLSFGTAVLVVGPIVETFVLSLFRRVSATSDGMPPTLLIAGGLIFWFIHFLADVHHARKTDKSPWPAFFKSHGPRFLVRFLVLSAFGILYLHLLGSWGFWPTAGLHAGINVAQAAGITQFVFGGYSRQQTLLPPPVQLLDHVGNGGMGDIYKGRIGWHVTRLGIVKVARIWDLDPSKPEDFFKKQAILAAIRSEARWLKALTRRFPKSTAFTRFIMFRDSPNRPKLVMEEAPGKDLRDLQLNQPGHRFTVRDSFARIEGLLESLETVHKLVIHGDLKPENVMYDEATGRTTILDFGVAQDAFNPGDSDPERVSGTPDYVAPEKYLRTTQAAFNRDTYAVGVMLYEALTGRSSPLAKGPHGTDIEMKPGDQRMHPERLRQIKADLDLPNPLKAILLKALNADPDLRYRTAADMRAAIEAAKIIWSGEDRRLGMPAAQPVAALSPHQQVTVKRGFLPPSAFPAVEPPPATVLVAPEAIVDAGAQGELRPRTLPDGKTVLVKTAKDKNSKKDQAALDRDAQALMALTLKYKDHPAAMLSFPRFISYDRKELVMEWVPGMDLHNFISAQEDGRVPAAQALDILDGLLAALGRAHGTGIIHRDLKPDNVMYDAATGRVTLLDFGLWTKPGLTVETAGTPKYLAPEVVPGVAMKHAPTLDIYGAGLVAEELLTGHPYPHHERYDGRGIEGFKRMIMDGVWDKRLESLRNAKDIHPAVAAFVAKALAIEPKERYQSVGEMRAALAKAREELLAAPTEPSPEKAVTSTASPASPAGLGRLFRRGGGIGPASFLLPVALSWRHGAMAAAVLAVIWLARRIIRARRNAAPKASPAEEDMRDLILTLKRSLDPMSIMDIHRQLMSASEAYKVWIAGSLPENPTLDDVFALWMKNPDAVLNDASGKPPAYPLVVVKKLGGGTMGDVFAVRSGDSDREVALKTLSHNPQDKSLSGLIRSLGLIMLERPRLFHIASLDLKKPLAPKPIPVNVGAGRVAMEIVPGETVRSQLNRLQWLSLDEGVMIIKALASLHDDAGLIFNDLRPENVMIERDAEGKALGVRFIDLGAAVLRSRRERLLGDTVRTWDYFAPERLWGLSTTASDVFSLGVMLSKFLDPQDVEAHPEIAQVLKEASNLSSPEERPSLSRLARAFEDALTVSPVKPARWQNGLNSVRTLAEMGEFLDGRKALLDANDTLRVTALINDMRNRVVTFFDAAMALQGLGLKEEVTENITRKLGALSSTAGLRPELWTVGKGGNGSFFGEKFYREVVSPLLLSFGALLPGLSGVQARAAESILGSLRAMGVPAEALADAEKLEKILLDRKVEGVESDMLHGIMDLLGFSPQEDRSSYQDLADQVAAEVQRTFQDRRIEVHVLTRGAPLPVPGLRLDQMMWFDDSTPGVTRIYVHDKVLDSVKAQGYGVNQFLGISILHERLESLGLSHEQVEAFGFRLGDPKTSQMDVTNLIWHARGELYHIAGSATFLLDGDVIYIHNHLKRVSPDYLKAVGDQILEPQAVRDRWRSLGGSEISIELPELHDRDRVGSLMVLGEPLGGGAAGDIFLASRVDAQGNPTGRRVIIKRLASGWKSAKLGILLAAIGSYRNEARKLSHMTATLKSGSPSPRLLGQGPFHLVIDYLPGNSLAALDLPRSVKALRALAAAHRAGVVHQDVKAANFFELNQESAEPGAVKLIDFGSTVFTAGASGLRERQPGDYSHTPFHAAPELYLGALAGPASDVWSAAKTIKNGIPSETRRRPDVWPLLKKGLAENPAIRPTAEELAGALEKLPDVWTGPLLDFEPDMVVSSVGEIGAFENGSFKDLYEYLRYSGQLKPDVAKVLADELWMVEKGVRTVENFWETMEPSMNNLKVPNKFWEDLGRLLPGLQDKARAAASAETPAPGPIGFQDFPSVMDDVRHRPGLTMENKNTLAALIDQIQSGQMDPGLARPTVNRLAPDLQPALEYLWTQARETELLDVPRPAPFATMFLGGGSWFGRVENAHKWEWVVQLGSLALFLAGPAWWPLALATALLSNSVFGRKHTYTRGEDGQLRLLTPGEKAQLTRLGFALTALSALPAAALWFMSIPVFGHWHTTVLAGVLGILVNILAHRDFNLSRGRGTLWRLLNPVFRLGTVPAAIGRKTLSELEFDEKFARALVEAAAEGPEDGERMFRGLWSGAHWDEPLDVTNENIRALRHFFNIRAADLPRYWESLRGRLGDLGEEKARLFNEALQRLQTEEVRRRFQDRWLDYASTEPLAAQYLEKVRGMMVIGDLGHEFTPERAGQDDLFALLATLHEIIRLWKSSPHLQERFKKADLLKRLSQVMAAARNKTLRKILPSMSEGGIADAGGSIRASSPGEEVLLTKRVREVMGSVAKAFALKQQSGLSHRALSRPEGWNMFHAGALADEEAAALADAFRAADERFQNALNRAGKIFPFDDGRLFQTLELMLESEEKGDRDLAAYIPDVRKFTDNDLMQAMGAALAAGEAPSDDVSWSRLIRVPDSMAAKLDRIHRDAQAVVEAAIPDTHAHMWPGALEAYLSSGGRVLPFPPKAWSNSLLGTGPGAAVLAAPPVETGLLWGGLHFLSPLAAKITVVLGLSGAAWPAVLSIISVAAIMTALHWLRYRKMGVSGKNLLGWLIGHLAFTTILAVPGLGLWPGLLLSGGLHFAANLAIITGVLRKVPYVGPALASLFERPFSLAGGAEANIQRALGEYQQAVKDLAAKGRTRDTVYAALGAGRGLVAAFTIWAPQHPQADFVREGVKQWEKELAGMVWENDSGEARELGIYIRTGLLAQQPDGSFSLNPNWKEGGAATIAAVPQSSPVEALMSARHFRSITRQTPTPEPEPAGSVEVRRAQDAYQQALKELPSERTRESVYAVLSAAKAVVSTFTAFQLASPQAGLAQERVEEWEKALAAMPWAEDSDEARELAAYLGIGLIKNFPDGMVAVDPGWRQADGRTIAAKTTSSPVEALLVARDAYLASVPLKDADPQAVLPRMKALGFPHAGTGMIAIVKDESDDRTKDGPPSNLTRDDVLRALKNGTRYEDLSHAEIAELAVYEKKGVVYFNTLKERVWDLNSYWRPGWKLGDGGSNRSIAGVRPALEAARALAGEALSAEVAAAVVRRSASGAAGVGRAGAVLALIASFLGLENLSLAGTDVVQAAGNAAQAGGNGSLSWAPIVFAVLMAPFTIAFLWILFGRNALSHLRRVREVEVAGKRYRVRRVLNESRSGSVYEAIDPSTRLAVAIKVTRTGDPTKRESALREIEALRRIGGGNGGVPRALASAEGEGVVTLVMDLAGGRTLGRILNDRRLFQLEKAVPIGDSLLEALEAVHGAGLIHQDVRPENIKWDGARAFLLDLNFSQDVDEPTRWGMVGRFTPPEAAGKDLVLRPSYDLYSVGVLLQDLMGFAPAGHLDGDGEMIGNLVSQARARLEAVRQRIPPGPLQAFFEKALAENPLDRFQTAAEMRAALKDLLPRTPGGPGRGPGGDFNNFRDLDPVTAGLARMVTDLTPVHGALNLDPRARIAQAGVRKLVQEGGEESLIRAVAETLKAHLLGQTVMEGAADADQDNERLRSSLLSRLAEGQAVDIPSDAVFLENVEGFSSSDWSADQRAALLGELDAGARFLAANSRAYIFLADEAGGDAEKIRSLLPAEVRDRVVPRRGAEVARQGTRVDVVKTVPADFARRPILPVGRDGTLYIDPAAKNVLPAISLEKLIQAIGRDLQRIVFAAINA